MCGTCHRRCLKDSWSMAYAMPTGTRGTKAEDLAWVVKPSRRNSKHWKRLVSLASLTKAKREIKKSVNDHNVEHHGSKWYVTLHVTFVKRNNVGEEVEHETIFREEVATLIRMEEYEEQFDAQVDLFMRRIADSIQNGSGWSISRVDKIVLSMAVYNPTSGLSFIRTPKSLKRKQAIINIQNDGEKCFVWAVLSALHPQQQNAERLSKYKPLEKELAIDGLEFPMKVCDIKKSRK